MGSDEGLQNEGLNALGGIGIQGAGATSLSNVMVVGNNVESQGSPLFLVGANVRGEAFNPIRDGKLDDWYTYRVQDAQNIRSYGFNVIRLVTYWEQLETSTSPTLFSYNNSYLQQLVQTVQTYNQYGVYVYIDLHEHGALNTLGKFIPIVGNDVTFGDAFYNDTSASSAREHLRQLWLMLSGTFRDDSGVIGYGICNEPHHSGSLTDQQVANYWFDIADYVIGSLRSVGDSHIVFVNFAPYSQTTKYMSRKLNDNNVVYEVHFYYGIDTGSNTLVNNDYNWLLTQFNTSVKPRLVQFGVPYIIGEFGFETHQVSPGDGMDIWIKNVLTILKSQPNVQGWLYWSYDEDAGNLRGGGWQQTLVAYVPSGRLIVQRR
ncbi:MAG: cellulase family glycosylhydrolase [Candidatus Bathyarchaeia archaeon]